MIKNLRGSIMLLIAAIIWGTAFVAQSAGMQYVQPFTYNALRMLIGGVVLIPVLLAFRAVQKDLPREEKRKTFQITVRGGLVCGTVLFAATSLQQVAMVTTSAGKAGFITTLYIVLVPLIKLLFLRQKTAKSIWLFVGMAVCGFYLLCINENFSVAGGDLLMLACAVFFALHIIVIDHFNGKGANGIMLACFQFFVSGILALIMMTLFEQPRMEAIWAAKWTILYTGMLSSGVAYTLQILGQRRTEPTLATLLMSLESVFAALSGWLILNERFTLKEGVGCLLVFAAVILAQLQTPAKVPSETD